MVRKLTAKAALVLIAGLSLWPTASSAATNPTIEAPYNGQSLGSPTFNVHVRAASDRNGIGKARLVLQGTGISGSKEIWCGHCPEARWNSGNMMSINESFTFDIRPHSKHNGTFQLTLMTTEWTCGTGGINCSESTSWTSTTNTVAMNAAPKAPAWVSGYPQGTTNGPTVTLKWVANDEPDIQFYEVSRSGPGGDFVDQVTQGACSGGRCTYVDQQFAGTGYTGSYSYSIIAHRKNSSGSDTIPSSASTRSTSLKEPPPPTSGGGGGSGGSGGGSGGTGGSGGGSGGSGGSGGGSGGGLGSDGGDVQAPPPGLSENGGEALPTASGGRGALPGGGDPSEFYSGTYSTRLPYQDRTLLRPGGGQTRTRTREVAIGPGWSTPPDVMKMLIPVAGGLLFILLAAHARRLLRDK